MNGVFSVIIPVFNGAQFLVTALNSVIHQEQPPCEVIIIDDCSTDNSYDIAFNMADSVRDITIKVLRMDANSGGPSKPINFGIMHAIGDYIAVLDQDDLFTPGRLRWHKMLFDSIPEAGVVIGLGKLNDVNCSMFLQSESLNSEIITTSCKVSDNAYLLHGDDAFRLLLLRNCFAFGFPGFSFRRSVWKQMKGVDEHYRIAGDYDFLCRAALTTQFVYTAELAYLRRNHDTNATNNRFRAALECAKVRNRCLLLRPEIRKDEHVFSEMKSFFHTLAFWTREAGFPLVSTKLYILLLQRFGFNTQLLLELAKVWPVFIVRRLLGIKPAINHWTMGTP